MFIDLSFGCFCNFETLSGDFEANEFTEQAADLFVFECVLDERVGDLVLNRSQVHM